MRKAVLIAVSVFSMGVAQVAWADEQSSAPAPTAVATAKNDPNEVQCKRMQVTGQLLPGPKVCHTRAQWEGIQRQSQEEAQRAQDATGAGTGAVGPGR